jgi:hypothetical protein
LKQELGISNDISKAEAIRYNFVRNNIKEEIREEKNMY